MAGHNFTDENARRLAAEWEATKERVAARSNDDPYAERYGVRWVLVNLFGDELTYTTDALFHAQVVAAEQMIGEMQRIASAVRTEV